MINNYSAFSILHGEDDICDIRMMARMLKKIEYQGEYNNVLVGGDVLVWMNDIDKPKLPNLLILDIGLPGTNGKEILASLRQEERTMYVPIIMMSGSNSQRDYRECIVLGANAYIQKSSNVQELDQTLKCLIEGFVLLSSQKFF